MYYSYVFYDFNFFLSFHHLLFQVILDHQNCLLPMFEYCYQLILVVEVTPIQPKFPCLCFLSYCEISPVLLILANFEMLHLQWLGSYFPAKRIQFKFNFFQVHKFPIQSVSISNVSPVNPTFGDELDQQMFEF